MHDAKGRELKVGDAVLIPATITAVSPGADYCNATVQTAVGRRPDGQKESVSAINTGVMFRNNEGDDNADMYSVEKPADLPASADQEPPAAA